MNKYDKFKLLGDIKEEYLAEARTENERRPSFQRYVPALVLACTVLLAVIFVSSQSLLNRMKDKEIPVLTLTNSFVSDYKGDSIMNYLIDDQSLFVYFDSKLKTNEQIMIVSKAEDTKQEKLCPGFYEALKLCEDNRLKDISVIRVNSATLMLKAVRNDTDYLIPVYYEKRLPEEYREIKTYEQLPEPSDLVAALNSSQEYIYGGNEIILHTREK